MILYNKGMFDFATLLSLLNPANYGINLLDIIIVLVVIFYAYEGYTLGFLLASVDLASFILSFIIALKLYPFVAKILTTSFGLPIGFANAIAFLLLAFICEIILGILFRKLLRFIPKLRPGHIVARIFKKIDHYLGLVPGFISAFIVLSFLLAVIVSLPSSPLIKNLVTDSKLGAKLVANTSFFESRLNDIFGGALSETLNFITVKPESDETLNLHFSVKEGAVDAQAEQEMLKLVNIEREKAGLAPVIFDDKLRDVARAHSQDMFQRGYFSHYSPEGTSPFDRMAAAGIEFTYAGENLALAPSTPLAMQGLMNSPGHRANILNPNFGKLGIGVIDGGMYGKMYSQEFTD
jgi:uncharacterized protein YkwD